MLAALAAGTPMIIVPLAADQPDNADRCLAAGVARVLTAEDLDAGAVERAVNAVVQRSDLSTPGARGGRRGRGRCRAPTRRSIGSNRSCGCGGVRRQDVLSAHD